MKRALGLAVTTALVPGFAFAQDVISLDVISILGATPVLGSGVDSTRVPSRVQVIGSDKVLWNGVPSVTKALSGAAGGVTLNEAQNNPFQPNLVYRGFEASPLAGNAQGIAVYVNGSRFNTPFGDTMQWDLIPDIAVQEMNLGGANPVFGLNALGGSLAVRLNDGFAYEGTELAVTGGSFGRFGTSAQHGRQFGDYSIYFAGNFLREDGWRDFSPSRLIQLFGDFGMRRDGTEIHFDIIGANNELTGNGPLPVELLALDPSMVFTHPDTTINQYVRLNMRGTHQINETESLQGGAYVGRLNQRTVNGDAVEAEPCDPPFDAFVCNEDGDILTDQNGNNVPNFVQNSIYSLLPDFAADFADGGPYALLNRTNTQTTGYGASLQLTSNRDLFERPNHFVIGASLDGSSTHFTANSELGALTLDRGYQGPGIILDTDEIIPVDLLSSTLYAGLFFADTLDVTDKLSLSLSGRLNFAHVKLDDQLGTALNGDHRFLRFNPGVGATYRINEELSVYGGYSEANRAPTPAELSCADPAAPCSLTNFFLGDPPLKQVVARTVEAGIRGEMNPTETVSVRWRLGAFHTRTQDDIIFIASPVFGRGYFQNIGSTQRQGIEAGIEVAAGKLTAFAEYAFTDATFRSPLIISSPRNPFADANGRIMVDAGDHLPGVAAHVVSFGADYAVTDRWTVGINGKATSGQFLFGDESNQNDMTRPYVVFGLDTTYKVNDTVELFAAIENLFNTRYETFGTFAETGEVPIVELPGASNPRTLSPGAPFAVYGGLKVRF